MQRHPTATRPSAPSAVALLRCTNSPHRRACLDVGLSVKQHVENDIPYGDLLEEDYLFIDNRGRGFVLIGHSQGSSLLRRLIRDEIDGHPIQSRIGPGSPASAGEEGSQRRGRGRLVQVCTAVPDSRANGMPGCIFFVPRDRTTRSFTLTMGELVDIYVFYQKVIRTDWKQRLCP